MDQERPIATARSHECSVCARIIDAAEEEQAARQLVSNGEYECTIDIEGLWGCRVHHTEHYQGVFHAEGVAELEDSKRGIRT